MTESKKYQFMPVCGTLYRRKPDEVCSSGSDIALEELIIDLAPFAISITAIGLAKAGLPTEEKIGPNITVLRVPDEEVPKTMQEIHENRHKGKTDAVITQVMLMDVALRTAKKLGLKTIFIQQDLYVSPKMGPGEELEPTIMLAPSRAAANKIKKVIGREALHFPYSFRHRERAMGDPSIQPLYDVIMFNPNKLKGGNIFFELARRFPNRSFIGVKGWTDLKRADGEFDLELMKLMARSYSGNPEAVQIPEEPSCPNLPNVLIVDPILRVGNLIRSAKLVILPSQWEENLPQIVVEAGLNGSHVIGSNVGGVAEAMEYAGMPLSEYPFMLVNDYTNPDAWVESLNLYFKLAPYIPLPKPQLPQPDFNRLLSLLK